MEHNCVHIFAWSVIAPEGGYSTTRPRNERDVSNFDVRPVSVRPCVRLLQRFDPKMDHFRVTQNGSIPREGPLETVQKRVIFW